MTENGRDEHGERGEQTDTDRKSIDTIDKVDRIRADDDPQEGNYKADGDTREGVPSKSADMYAAKPCQYSSNHFSC